jgi:hypothetical protein
MQQIITQSNMNNAYKTALKRTSLSKPIKELINQNLIPDNASVLDYGCGKGFDADTLGFDKYDPHFFKRLPDRHYEIIICSYVLNVIDEQEADKVLNNIKELLMPSGVAYITVRRDIKNEGFTKIGTYQRNVLLSLPIVKQCGGFCIYKLTKES